MYVNNHSTLYIEISTVLSDTNARHHNQCKASQPMQGITTNARQYIHESSQPMQGNTYMNIISVIHARAQVGIYANIDILRFITKRCVYRFAK